MPVQFLVSLDDEQIGRLASAIVARMTQGAQPDPTGAQSAPWQNPAMSQTAQPATTVSTTSPPSDPWAAQPGNVCQPQQGAGGYQPGQPFVPIVQPVQQPQQSYQPAVPAQGNVITKQTKAGLLVFSLDMPDAPMCNHGIKAVHLHGTDKNGKPYDAWTCVYGTGDQWKSKCDFHKWV